jgi:quercetin dioxygenase-like cupin family protein
MEISRRSLVIALSAAAGSAGLAVADSPVLSSFAKPFASLTPRTHGGNTYRQILDGMTSSGDHIEVHETTLAAGASPHPPHRHKHEELFLMIKGQLAVTIEGKTTVIGPGAAAFVASNQLHGAHNPGSEAAQYFVVATGV